MAQRVGRGIALLFNDSGTRRGLVVSSTTRPYFSRGKDLVPIVQEAGWAPGQVWTGGKSLPTGIRSPDLPARIQSLCRLSYPEFVCDIERKVTRLSTRKCGKNIDSTKLRDKT